LFHDEFTNGTWLVTVAFFTPGMARRLARSVRVRAAWSGSPPMLTICTRTSSFSARPLTSRTCSRRSLMMNRALQMMAQVSVISSALSAGAVLCRVWVEWMGGVSMGGSLSRREARRAGEAAGPAASLALELDRGRDLHRPPGRQQAGQHAGHDREHEGQQQHAQVQVRELGVAGRLLA